MSNNGISGFRLGGLALCGLLTVSCAVPPPAASDQHGGERSADTEVQAASAIASSAPSVVPGEHTDQALPESDQAFLYKVLVGEFAARRGQPEIAAKSLMDAARMSRDFRFARRATHVALDSEQLDLAHRAASLWLELEPKSNEPLESLALILTEQGQIADATARFSELLTRVGDKESTGAMLRRIAGLLGQLPHEQHALAVMQRIVTEREADPDAHFAAAFLADRAGREEQVIESLNRALALRPGWQDAGLAKLGHLIQNHYPRETIDAFARAFLERTPKAARVRTSYARYLVEQGDTGAALDQFETLLKYQPDNATGLMSAALLSVDKESYQQARQYLLKLLELTPEDDQVRLQLGRIAEQREHYTEAEKWYRAVSDPDYRLTAELQLASVIQQRSGVAAAMQHLATIDPDNEAEFVRLTLTRDLVLRAADQLERAQQFLDDAVARYPDNNDLLYARGLLAAQLDEIALHEHDMRALLADNPNNAQALNALGYTLADSTDRIQEALELISKALKLRPGDPFILDSMGWVQYRMGHAQEAIRYLEQALSKRADPEIAAHLGEVLWATGNQDRARDIWSQARGKHPDNDVLRETIQRLTQ